MKRSGPHIPRRERQKLRKSTTCMSEIGSGRVGELGSVKPYHTCQIYVPESGRDLVSVSAEI